MAVDPGVPAHLPQLCPAHAPPPPTHSRTPCHYAPPLSCTAQSFTGAWFLDPLYRGDWPAERKAVYGDLLPSFTPEQRRFILDNPQDFIALQHYTGNYVYQNATNPPLLLSEWRAALCWIALCWIALCWGAQALACTLPWHAPCQGGMRCCAAAQAAPPRAQTATSCRRQTVPGCLSSQRWAMLALCGWCLALDPGTLTALWVRCDRHHGSPDPLPLCAGAEVAAGVAPPPLRGSHHHY